MKNVLKECKGACLFYILIILMIFLISVNNKNINARYDGGGINSYSYVN